MATHRPESVPPIIILGNMWACLVLLAIEIDEQQTGGGVG